MRGNCVSNSKLGCVTKPPQVAKPCIYFFCPLFLVAFNVRHIQSGSRISRKTYKGCSIAVRSLGKYGHMRKSAVARCRNVLQVPTSYKCVFDTPACRRIIKEKKKGDGRRQHAATCLIKNKKQNGRTVCKTKNGSVDAAAQRRIYMKCETQPAAQLSPAALLGRLNPSTRPNR